MKKCQQLTWKKDKPGIADEVARCDLLREIDYLEGKEVSAKAQETLSLGGVKVNTSVTCQSLFFGDFWK